jgi:superfamily II DNA helicase RecQ
MYTHCTHQSVKDVILQRFTSLSSLRIVIATIAFGMGIDCPVVCHIIHWGVPDDEEMYVLGEQEGMVCYHVLYCFTGEVPLVKNVHQKL